jgi:hypothetical protein
MVMQPNIATGEKGQVTNDPSSATAVARSRLLQRGLGIVVISLHGRKLLGNPSSRGFVAACEKAKLVM